MGRQFKRARWATVLLAVILSLAVSLLAASCGDEETTDASESPTAGGTLTFASFQPFTGPNAVFGPMMMSGAWTAVDLINENGGILGNDVTAEGVDTHGDPTQAVPAAQQMLATTEGLVGILGPSSDEANATAPILNEAKIPFFADTGLTEFNQTDLEYFWRIAPADDAKAYAMAILGWDGGYRNAALVYGSDPGSVSMGETLKAAFDDLGGQVVSDQKLAQRQSSYRTEIQRMLSSNPEVIIGELDPQTAATFMRQLVEINGSPIPFIASETSLEAPWVRAVSRAIGLEQMSEYVVGVQPHVVSEGPAYDTFNDALRASEGVKEAAGAAELDADFLSTDPYVMGWYDSINMMALAMIAANTLDPAAYNNSILEVTAPGEGKTEVEDFAAGKAALEAGEQIQYVGVSGPFVFNQWHSSSPPYEGVRVVAAGETEVVGVVPVDRITELTNQ